MASIREHIETVFAALAFAERQSRPASQRLRRPGEPLAKCFGSGAKTRRYQASSQGVGDGCPVWRQDEKRSPHAQARRLQAVSGRHGPGCGAGRTRALHHGPGPWRRRGGAQRRLWWSPRNLSSARLSLRHALGVAGRLGTEVVALSVCGQGRPGEGGHESKAAELFEGSRTSFSPGFRPPGRRAGSDVSPRAALRKTLGSCRGRVHTPASGGICVGHERTTGQGRLSSEHCPCLKLSGKCGEACRCW